MDKKLKLGGLIAVATMIGCAVYSNVKKKLQNQEKEVIDIPFEAEEVETSQN